MSKKQGLYWAALVLVALLAAVVAAYTVAVPRGLELNGSALDDPPTVTDVALIDTHGETTQLAKWRGKTLLVFFGYANCPDVCPLTMAQLASTYRELGEPEELQILMVTVDPERDSPAQLEAYVERFHHDFAGLTGTPEMIAEASARFYVASIGSDRNADGTVSHSSHVTLVDAKGRMRFIYNQDKTGAPLKEDLSKLLAHDRNW